MAKKNVLFIINQLHSGGAEKVVANLSRDLSAFYNVHIAIFNDLDKVAYPFQGNLIRISLPFSKTANNNSSPARAIRLFLLIRHLRRIKREHGIDVAISFLEASNFINILSKRKEKVIISVRSYLTEEINKNQQISIYRKFINKLYKRAQAVVVPSLSLAEDLVANFGIARGKIHEIHNYLDFDLINQLKEVPYEHIQYATLFKAPTLINVGRLHPAKGQWHLLPVLKKVKAAHPLAKLVILGEGDLKEALMERCHQLQLKVCTKEQLPAMDEQGITSCDVVLLGAQKNPFQFLYKSSVFLFPSVYEGFPNALLEAMAMGLPVVAADCNSGPREILAPGTDLRQKAAQAVAADYGFLMPPVKPLTAGNSFAGEPGQEAEEWATVVDRLLADTEQSAYYSARAKARAQDYSKAVIIGKWTTLIDQ